MVSIGDCFLLMPTHCGSLARDDEGTKYQVGTVVEIHSHKPEQGFALVKFEHTRECFALTELEDAPRAAKRKRR